MIKRHLYAAARLLLVAIALSLGAVSPALTEGKPALEISERDFSCIRDMTPVRGFFVDSLTGDLDATLAVANSPNGGAYPPGSVVQLVPTEVMVKHPEGTSPATKDWEFFELTVSPEGSKIAKRGFVDVNNRFGGNCLGCHAKAKPQWDMICETGHGCDPIPLTKAMVRVIQKTDPRCESMPALSAEEKQLLGQLQQLLR
ncbi:hypothetical protein [Litorivivens sp.]|uniref:hypothetical protein n=1 Tax=Litorivivens sp. TaxID=2020868 RepID=UPI0035639AAA